jgi:hypothetical protein
MDKKKKKGKNKKNKNKQGSKFPTTARHVGKQPFLITRAGSVDDSKITQTTYNPKYPCRLCKGSHLLNDFPGISKVIEACSTHIHQPMSLVFEQHVDDLPSTSQDTIGKKKSRVKFSCRLCGRSHQTHLFPHMDEALKLLEDMTISQPQLIAAYHNISFNPPIVDGMINLVTFPVSLVDQVVNMITFVVELVSKVVDPIPSSIDLTLSLESATQAVDPFQPVDPILPLESETQVVDLISSSINPTLPLDNKPDVAQVFLFDRDTTVIGGIHPSPVEPSSSNEAVFFYWVALTGPCLPSHILFKITVQVCGQDGPQMLIDEGASVSIFSSISWKDLGFPQLVSFT